MELNDDKKDALRAFLSQMGEQHLILLVHAMDYARASGAKDIPYDFIFTVLRPTLFQMRPPRKGTAQRVLCNPFEDLLIPYDPPRKQETLIARASIQPVWEWLHKRGGATFKSACDSMDSALKGTDQEAIWDAQCYLWRTASGLIEAALDDADASGTEATKLAKTLGRGSRVEDMREMYNILLVAQELETLKTKLPPKPISKFLAKHITAVKNCYNETAESQPGIESWIVVAAMRRLLKPVDVLKVVKSLSPEGDDSIVAISDLAKVGNYIIGGLEDHVKTIEEMAQTGGKSDDMLDLIKEYVKTFDSITLNLNIRRDGDWGQRLFSTRKKVSDALGRTVVSQAPTKLAQALKQRSVKAGRTKRKVSDLRADLDPESYSVARNAAQSMKDCLRIADRIGMMSTVRSVANEMVDQLEQFSDQLLEDIQNVPDDYKVRAREHVIMVAHLMEFLVDSDQADFFLRRALRRINPESTDSS